MRCLCRSMALLTASAISSCWGRNSWGNLGIGNTAQIGDNEHPNAAPIVDVGGPHKLWHMIPMIGHMNWPASMLAWDVIVLNGAEDD